MSMISSILPVGLNLPIQGVNTIGSPGGSTSASGGTAFAEQLDKLSALQNNVDQLAVKAATGDLESVQALTIASTDAQLMTQLTVTVRNKAVEAFNDIMRMQV